MPFAPLLRETKGEDAGAALSPGCHLQQSGEVGHAGKITPDEVTAERQVLSLPLLRTAADGRGKEPLGGREGEVKI